MFFADLKRGQNVAYKYLIPVVEDRRKKEKEQGEEYKKPVRIVKRWPVGLKLGWYVAMAYGFRGGDWNKAWLFGSTIPRREFRFDPINSACIALFYPDLS